MSTLELFTYADTEVRVVAIEGEPWFVLADLAKVLDITNPRNVAARLSDDMKGVHRVDTLGGSQQVTIVSEAGMYEVVIRSDKPEAAAFRRWITTEVLPTIRKTGAYGVAKQLTGPELMAAALVEAQSTLELMSTRMAQIEPKANAFDLWLSSNVHYSVDTAAKALSAAGVPNMGRNRLFDLLSRKGLGWAYKAPDGWRPYQQHGPEGTKRLDIKLASWLNDRTGATGSSTTLRVTAKGIADLAEHFGVMPDAVAEHLDEAA